MKRLSGTICPSPAAYPQLLCHWNAESFQILTYSALLLCSVVFVSVFVPVFVFIFVFEFVFAFMCVFAFNNAKSLQILSNSAVCCALRCSHAVRIEKCGP